MIYFLIGFKGCGKSVIGQCLAELLKTEFVDLDHLIENWYERKMGQRLSFRDIYQKLGDGWFRQMEHLALHQIEAKGSMVISVGGGTLMNGRNLRVLKESGKVVYIVVDTDELYERIMARGTPAFFDPENPRASFDELYEDRMPIYETMADYRVDTTGLDIEQSAQRMYDILQGTQPSDC